MSDRDFIIVDEEEKEKDKQTPDTQEKEKPVIVEAETKDRKDGRAAEQYHSVSGVYAEEL